tara:strand:- start:7207 stop:9987 length:2781 start_codon:yes stop_codon:yes gene_type:complete
MTQQNVRGGTVKQSLPFQPGYVPAPNYDQMEANSKQAMANAQQSLEAIQRMQKMQEDMASTASQNRQKDNLSVIGQYSGIAKSALEAWQKQSDEKEKLEAINLAHQTMASLKEQEQYGKSLGLAEANYMTQNKFAAAAGAQGASFEQAETIRQLDGTWKGVHYVRELYKLFGEEYGGSLLREFQGGDSSFIVPRNGEMVEIKASEAQSRAERLAVVEQHRSNKFKEWGIHHTDPSMVQNELSPLLRETERKFHAGMEKQDVANRTSEAVADAQRNFAFGDRDLGKLWSGTLGAYHGNKVKAWESIQRYYTDMLDADLMTWQQAQEDWLQPSWRNKDKTAAADFQPRYAEISQAMQRAHKRLLQEKEQNDRIGRQNHRVTTAKIAAERAEAGTDSKSWWDSVNEDWRTRFPGWGDHPEFTEAMTKGRTLEGREKAARTREIRSLLANNLLRPHHLITDDEKLQYMDQAVGMERSAVATNNYEEATAQLEAHAGSAGMFKFQDNGKLGKEALQWVVQAKRLFAQQVALLKTNNPDLALPGNEHTLQDAAIKSTFEEIKKLEQDKSKVFYRDTEGLNTFPNLYEGQGVAKSIETASIRRKQILEHINNAGTKALTVGGVLMNEEQYRAHREGFGKPGWGLPPVIRSYAHEYKLDPWDLYNDLGEGFGGGLFKPIKLSKEDEEIKQGLTLEEKLLLGASRPAPRVRGIMKVDSRRGGDGAVETLYKLGDTESGVNPLFDLKAGYVPLGLGKEIQSASKKYRVDPAIVTGLITQESQWDTTARNPVSGAVGLGQFLRSTAADMGIDPMDPNQAVYGAAKYLRWCMDYIGTDNIEIGLYAYNSGPGRVEGLVKKLGVYGALEYLRSRKNNTENREYVPKVMSHGCKFGGGVRACNHPTMMRSGFIDQAKANGTLLENAYPDWVMYANKQGNQ